MPLGWFSARFGRPVRRTLTGRHKAFFAWARLTSSVPIRKKAPGLAASGRRQRAPHRAEAAPVLDWRKSDLASEQLAEKARVLVADRVGDRLDRLVAGLEHLFGLLEAQRVDVLERRQSGGALEANKGQVHLTRLSNLT